METETNPTTPSQEGAANGSAQQQDTRATWPDSGSSRLRLADPLSDSFELAVNADLRAGSHWSVPWSDLMMVMFVLFATLVTAQALQHIEDTPDDGNAFLQDTTPGVDGNIEEVERETIVKEPELLPQPTFEPLMKINVFEQSRQAIKNARLENVEIALLDDRSVRVSVQGPMLFETGSANLRSEVSVFLTSLARVIGKTPFNVNVVGHTDNRPINTELFPSNWELSSVRASRVARYLIDSGDLNPARFTVLGHSQYQPVASNSSSDTRALNRRVEIIITQEVGDF